MADEWVKEAERKGEEAGNYADWIDSNETEIIETYLETITLDDVPDDFISSMYESYLEGKE